VVLSWFRSSCNIWMPGNPLITYSCKMKNQIALSGVGPCPASTVPSRRMSPCSWVNHPNWEQKSFGSPELQTDAGSSSSYPSSGDAGWAIGYSNLAYEVMTYAHSAAKRPIPTTTCYASRDGNGAGLTKTRSQPYPWHPSKPARGHIRG
jgi:hypothetical protein